MHISTGVVFFETSTDVLQKEESKRWILYPMFLVRHQPNLRNILTRKKSPTLTPKADALLRCTNFCTSSYVFVFVLFLIDKRLEKKCSRLIDHLFVQRQEGWRPSARHLQSLLSTKWSWSSWTSWVQVQFQRDVGMSSEASRRERIPCHFSWRYEHFT